MVSRERSLLPLVREQKQLHSHRSRLIGASLNTSLHAAAAAAAGISAAPSPTPGQPLHGWWWSQNRYIITGSAA